METKDVQAPAESSFEEVTKCRSNRNQAPKLRRQVLDSDNQDDEDEEDEDDRDDASFQS